MTRAFQLRENLLHCIRLNYKYNYWILINKIIVEEATMKEFNTADFLNPVATLGLYA